MRVRLLHVLLLGLGCGAPTPTDSELTDTFVAPVDDANEGRAWVDVPSRLDATSWALPAGDPLPTEPRYDRAWVTSRLWFIKGVDGVSEGFNLDADAVAADPRAGCGVADFQDAKGTPGIDNAGTFVLRDMVGTVVQGDDFLLQESVLDGGLMEIIRVVAPEEGGTEEGLRVELIPTIGAPFLAFNDTVLPFQTLERDVAIPMTDLGVLVPSDNEFVAGPFNLNLRLGARLARPSVVLRDAFIRFRVVGERLEGFVAGRLDVEEVSRFTATVLVDPWSIEFIRTTGLKYRDLMPDSLGRCTQISATVAFEAVPAFLFEPLPVP